MNGEDITKEFDWLPTEEPTYCGQKCDPRNCSPLMLMLEILHEYFITCNGQKERLVGAKLWSIISAYVIRPEITEEDKAWANRALEDVASRHNYGPDPDAEKKW
jgi:hypothetical protein